MDLDVTAELGEHRKPDVFGADDEVVVLIVGVDRAFDEAVGGGVEEGCYRGGEVGHVGGLQNNFAFEGFLEAGCGEGRVDGLIIINSNDIWV